jgi:5-methyltetrahydrofolate--homocysteine methyltransferase
MPVSEMHAQVAAVALGAAAKPGRIGVTLSEEFQLAPEQSTDAVITHHPEAKYFST